MSAKLLTDLPNQTDTCGCSLMEGRCAPHAAMVREIHEAWVNGTAEAGQAIWAYSDGYGSPGFIPEQGYDWSGIRDSSTDAIEAMWKALHA